MEGRRVLVHVTLHEDAGHHRAHGRHPHPARLRMAVMKADAVAPNMRKKWVADRVKEGIDVLICHPRLVQIGLDLIDFPTIVWDEIDYSVYVMR